MVLSDTRRIIPGPPDDREALASLATQAGLAGPDDGLGAVGDLELEEDVGDVVADGLGAEMQAAGDLLVAHSPG
jgi:hypothetical protein